MTTPAPSTTAKYRKVYTDGNGKYLCHYPAVYADVPHYLVPCEVIDTLPAPVPATELGQRLRDIVKSARHWRNTPLCDSQLHKLDNISDLIDRQSAELAALRREIDDALAFAEGPTTLLELAKELKSADADCPECGTARHALWWDNGCLMCELKQRDERIAALETKAHNMEQAAIANKAECERLKFELGNAKQWIKELFDEMDLPPELQRTVDAAADRIAAWPEWKRGVLEASGKATCDVPRQPVINSEPNLRCIFCSFAGDSLDALKQHSAECEGHPLMARAITLANDLRGMLASEHLPYLHVNRRESRRGAQLILAVCGFELPSPPKNGDMTHEETLENQLDSARRAQSEVEHRCFQLEQALAVTLPFREFSDEWYDDMNPAVVEFRKRRKAALFPGSEGAELGDNEDADEGGNTLVVINSILADLLNVDEFGAVDALLKCVDAEMLTPAAGLAFLMGTAIVPANLVPHRAAFKESVRRRYFTVHGERIAKDAVDTLMLSPHTAPSPPLESQVAVESISDGIVTTANRRHSIHCRGYRGNQPLDEFVCNCQVIDAKPSQVAESSFPVGS